MPLTHLELVVSNTHALIALTHDLLRSSSTPLQEELARTQLSILYSQLAVLEPADIVEDNPRVKLSSLAL
jgi:hypothetical protein